MQTRYAKKLRPDSEALNGLLSVFDEETHSNSTLGFVHKAAIETIYTSLHTIRVEDFVGEASWVVFRSFSC